MLPILRALARARRAALVWLLLCGALALYVRLTARDALPLDYDEPLYLSIAQDYARAVHAGDWQALARDIAPENPQLMKLLAGAALLPLPDAPPIPKLPNVEAPAQALQAARTLSVIGGALQVAALALLNPLAALLLAGHSHHAKFTALVMLEAAPGLTALLTVLAHQRSDGRWNRWMALSAMMLGLTAAGKYMYCIAGVAVLLDEALRGRRALKARAGALVLWGALACAMFVAVSPYLWAAPLERVLASVTFHARNADGSVNTLKYVWWQQLAWMATPAGWDAEHLPLRLDAAVAVLGAAGLPVLWRRRRVYALWLLLALVFLVFYPNKTPQYVLIAVTPLALSAAEAVRWLLLRALPALARRVSAARLARLWLPPLALGGAALGGVLTLNGNPYAADPAFRAATALIQQQMAPDEIALALVADPALRGGVLEPGWRSWNALPTSALPLRDGMLDYAAAAALLNQHAAGRHGVWVLTYQRIFGDPADTAQALLQRQTPINGPTLQQDFERNYALVHYRFDAGYAPVPEQPTLNPAESDPASGADRSLRSDGCAQLIPARVGPQGGTLEVTCFWRSLPYVKLPWDTRVRLSLQDAAGQTVVQTEPLIARSGFPWFRYQHTFAGVYPLTLPPGLPPGEYTLRVRPFTPDEAVAPQLRVRVRVE